MDQRASRRLAFEKDLAANRMDCHLGFGIGARQRHEAQCSENRGAQHAAPFLRIQASALAGGGV